MADEVKISALPAVVTPASTDIFAVVQGGVTKRETAAQALSLAQPNYGFLGYNFDDGDLTLTNPLPTNIRLSNTTPGNYARLPATNASTSLRAGTTSVWFRNIASVNAIIQDSDGTPIGEVPAESVALVTVTSNAAATGGYTVLEFFKTTGTQDMVSCTISVPNTNGAQLIQLPGLTNYSKLVNNFLQSATSHLDFSFAMPKRWDGGNVGFSIDWTASVTSGDVEWTISAAIVAPGDSYNVTFGDTETVATAAPNPALDNANSVITAITPSGTAVAGQDNKLIIRLTRVAGAGNDDMAGNAYFCDWKLLWNADAGNDE